MEKVKFWKNTSSEFDKIASKDANTIYYLTDTGKIYLGEKMYGGTDMPFTIVSKDDKRFSSFDTLFLKGENDGDFKLSVDPGVYCLADDMEFAFSAFILLKDYLKFMYEGQSADLVDLVYKSTRCTLPKGSFIYITENMLEIYCTHTDIDTYGPGGGSGESFTHCEAFIIGTYPVALDDNEHVCGLIEFDSIEKDMEDGMLTYPFEYAMMNTEGFKEGDTLVVTNNSDDQDSPGSWSSPKFKIGSAGVQATQITDVNYTNYQTMDQWLALNDGMYLVNTDKLSINVVGKNKVYSAGSAGFCGLLGIEENYNKSLSIPKGNYISVYTTEAGGSFYYKYKMMVIYQIEANPDAESNNRPSAGEAVVITLGVAPGNSHEGSSFVKDVKVYDFNESLMLQSTLNNYISLIFAPLSSPDTVPKDGQLAQWEGDADHGFKLKGVDAPKGVPITTINTTNKSEFATLKGILNHPDGMYLVDDCGVTNGDPQLTIASFKGHCSTILLASKAQFQQVMDSDEINCYKGSVIYILTGGDVSNGAIRYVSICNVPVGVSGEPSDPNRAFPDAGTSIVNIEIHPAMDNSYDIDGGTNTFFTHPGYASLLNSYANAYVAGGLISGKSSYSPGQLVQVVNDTDAWGSECRFTGVDASEFKSPFTLITNENATNYNTLDKLCHLEDGLYLCKDTYKANQDYIVDITFKGINLTDAATASFTGTPPAPDTNGNTKCKNGAIISVVTQEGSTKNKIVRITHGLSANIKTQGNGFDDIYIIAEPDDSTASTLVYGVTGENVKYYRPFSVNTIYGSLFPFAAMSNSLMGGSVNGTKMAIWNRPEGADMPTLGFADMPTSDKIQENESTSVVLNNHTEYRCKVMASLNLSLPETIPDDYNSRIVFESGETATTLSYTAGSIKFTGDDCDSSNAFVPAASTSYEVDIKYLGLDSSGNKRIIARVGAF